MLPIPIMDEEGTMKERREYKQLEEALKEEKAGSVKIRALSNWLMLEDLQWRLAHERHQLTEEEIYELRSRKGFMIQHSMLQGFKEDSDEYISAYEGAFEFMKPYIDTYMDGSLPSFRPAHGTDNREL